MTLSGTMNTNGDCNVVFSGNDGASPLQKVPPSERYTQSFLMAKVTDITFGTPSIANTCTATIPMTVTYRGGYSSYSSGTVTAAAGGTGALTGLGITSSSLTATLSDFSKATDALDVSVEDTKGSSLGKGLNLTITAALAQTLDPKDPAATVAGNRSAGLQIPIADSSACINPSCLTQSAAVVAAGPNTSCTVAADGKLNCWGLNDSDGILGNGTVTSGVNSVPVDIETILSATNFTAIRSVSIGGSHSCAVTETGRLWCWGSNSHGQLAQPVPGTAYLASPTEIVTSDVAAVATGLNHTCYLKTDGKVYCTGSNGRGQLGDTTTSDSATWKDTGLANVVALAAAGESSCALSGAAGSRTLYCWGDDTTFQTGRSAISGFSATPGAVDAINSSFVANGVSVAMGGSTAKGQVCLLTKRDTAPVDIGTLRCFGDNAAGQLGRDPVGLVSTGNSANSAVSPAFTPSAPAIAGIAMGTEHSCAVTTGRSLFCFGQQADGRLGSGATTPAIVHVPTLVTGTTGTRTVSISAGDAHTCAITTDHTAGSRVACFGKGADGALGNNTTTSTFTPADLFNNSSPFQPSARRCYGYSVSSP
jgi:alpha-tubulin suppressor-like RCC1 family protein